MSGALVNALLRRYACLESNGKGHKNLRRKAAVRLNWQGIRDRQAIESAQMCPVPITIQKISKWPEKRQVFAVLFVDLIARKSTGQRYCSKDFLVFRTTCHNGPKMQVLSRQCKHMQNTKGIQRVVLLDVGTIELPLKLLEQSMLMWQSSRSLGWDMSAVHTSQALSQAPSFRDMFLWRLRVETGSTYIDTWTHTKP